MAGHISAEEHAKRQRLYDLGMTDLEMSAECDVSSSSIGKWRKVKGLKTNYVLGLNKKKRLTDDLVAGFRDCHKAGMTIAATVSKLGTTVYAYNQWMESEGLKNQHISSNDIDKVPITDQSRKDILRMHQAGKEDFEIAAELGLQSRQVRSCIAKNLGVGNYLTSPKNKFVNMNSLPLKYSDTGRVLPPIHPPGPVVITRLGVEHTELYLANCFGDEIKPVIGPLASRRPAANLNAQDAMA